MKTEERQAILAVYYTQNKKLAKAINKEALKQGIDPDVFINRIGETKKKALDFLNACDFKVPEIKVDVSRIPGDMRKFNEEILISRLSKKDYVGTEEVKEYGQMEKWVANDIGYLVKKINVLNELFGKPPKVHVSQDKNVKLLIALIEQKQFNRINKKAQVSFTLKEYARYRGFTKEELTSGGGEIYKELKRDLYSGALTFYSIPIERSGKEYTVHGSLYQLEVPKERGGKWTVMFNGRYAEGIERILRGKEKGYFTHHLKEIADRGTSREIHLHEFYNQLVFRRRKSGTTMPTKITNILKAMNLPDKILKRPKECFKVLKNCLVYFSDKYPEELNSITIYNNYNKHETIKMALGLTDAFKSYDYEDFRDLILNAIKIKDFREALISFKGNKITKKKARRKKINLNEIDLEESHIINKIMDWAFDNWNIKKDKSEVYEYLHMFFNKAGYDYLKQLFEKEANKQSPNAIEFLFKVLPDELKGIKNNEVPPENKEIIEDMSNDLFN